MPQWSPPLTGGSEYAMGGYAHYLAQLQWSPPSAGRERGLLDTGEIFLSTLQWSPLSGGGDNLRTPGVKAETTALPQWSPPAIGGNTL
jgi:hypothetical protein